jgi:UDP-sugar transporter A1/2/3
VLLNLGSSSSSNNNNDSGENYQLGLIVVATASMISGLSATLTQRALVSSANKSFRSPLLMSAELAIYGIVVLLVNLAVAGEISSAIHSLRHWTWFTLLPVITNGFGGIVVGNVTKYAGGVVKGFALIAGIAITGIAQWLVEGKPLGMKDL